MDLLNIWAEAVSLIDSGFDKSKVFKFFKNSTKSAISAAVAISMQQTADNQLGELFEEYLMEEYA